MSWLIVGVGFAGAALMYALRAGGSKMSSTQIQAQLAAGAVVLDVRTPEEVAAGAYPGALTIPVQQLAARIKEVPTGKPVVVYCAAGARAGTAAEMLRAAGHAEVYNAGGLKDMPR